MILARISTRQALISYYNYKLGSFSAWLVYF